MSLKITPEMEKAAKEADEYLFKNFGITSSSYINEESHPELGSEAELKTTPKPEVITAKEDEYLSTYKFPFTQEQLLRLEKKIDASTSEYYLTTIKELSFDSFDANGHKLPYSEIRKRVVLSSIMLNIKGEVAPRFRQMRSPAPKIGAFYPPDQSLLSNDRQMIDLHWIYCQELNASNIPGYNGLFDITKPFDLIEATKFVNVAGTAERKSDLLGLPEFEQLQLTSMQSPKVKTRWQTIVKNCERNQSKIKDLFTGIHSKYKKETIKIVPDIYKAILIARGSPTHALKIFGLMTGRTEKIRNIARYVVKFKEAKLVS
jgi:hypothetical protein